VTGDWRKLHNEEQHNLYSSPNIIGMFKSMRMRWAWHVARKREKRNPYRILGESQKGRDNYEDEGGRIILTRELARDNGVV
jgi:hypothetical protein